jgi:hypothetical protein
MLQQLRERIIASKDNPEEAFEAFFDWYETILFSKKSIYDGLAEFESPLKEIIATHQAWGMIGGDGFKNYLSNLDDRFDEQVRLGLTLFGKADCFQGLLEARELFKRNDGEIPDDDDHRLWNLFYMPIEDLENIIGKYLVEHFS